MHHVPLVEVTRGSRVESLHFGSIAVCDFTGRLVAAWGDTGAIHFPRSAVKQIQALALVETGAADRYALNEHRLALACASHSAQPLHMAEIDPWLDELGLGDDALACGPAWPWRSEDRDARLLAGRGMRRAQHNCSGKHTGFLTTCLHMAWPTDGYERPEHPAQVRFRQTLAELAGCEADYAMDGCGLPTPALPLAAMAAAMAQLGDFKGLGTVRGNASARLFHACIAHPEYTSGTGEVGALVPAATAGEVYVKIGAEGFYTAMWPARGLGIALKVADGAARAADVAILGALAELGALPRGSSTLLDDKLRPTVFNSNHDEVGSLRWCGGSGR